MNMTPGGRDMKIHSTVVCQAMDGGIVLLFVMCGDVDLQVCANFRLVFVLTIRGRKMTELRRFDAMDLLHFNETNLDPLTETYNLSFYLSVMFTWPDHFLVQH